MSLKSRLDKLEGKVPRFASETEAMRHFFKLHPEKNKMQYAFEVHTFLYGEAGFTQPPFDKLVGSPEESNLKKDDYEGDFFSKPILKL